MKMVMKKIVMSLGLCLAINVVHASAGELSKRLGTLEGELKKLSGALSGLGGTPVGGGEAEEPEEGGGGVGVGVGTSPVIGGPEQKDQFPDKIDLITIEPFEKFYQAFDTLYFKPKWADSTFGADTFYSISSEVRDQIKEYIGRAWLEKFILDYCRKYIIAHDNDRSKSGQDPLWVYNEALKVSIDKVIARSKEKDKKLREKIQLHGDMATLLNDAAAQAVSSVHDILYYPNGAKADCGCLRSIQQQMRVVLGTGFNEEHPFFNLFNPISYLIYETMHITLDHNFGLIAGLIQVFDFDKAIDTADISVKGKTKFRAGFDGVFGNIMAIIVENEATIRAGLNIRPDTVPKGLLFNGSAKRDIITGKKMSAGWTPLTDDDLRYAIKLHLDGHSCYSVGMIPYNVPYVFKVSPEQAEKITKAIGAANINEKEQERLFKEAKGLMRPVWVANYLLKPLKDLDVNKRNAAALLTEIFNAMAKGTSAANPDVKDAAVSVTSINEDEWTQIFAILVQDSELLTKVKAFTTGNIKGYLEGLLAVAPQSFKQKQDREKAKAKGIEIPIKTIGQAILDAATVAPQRAEAAKKAAEAAKAANTEDAAKEAKAKQAAEEAATE